MINNNKQKIDGFSVFQYYMTVKLHFTTNYDFFKYHGKGSNITLDAYHQRRDHKLFEHLATKLKMEDVLPIMVSNFIENDSLWVGDFLTDYVEIMSCYKKWKSRIQALQYHFKKDLRNIVMFCIDNKLDFLDILVYNNQHPIILRWMMEEMIRPETFIIIDDITRFADLQEGDIIWDHEVRKLDKYRSFLPYDKQAMYEIWENEIGGMNSDTEWFSKHK